LAALDRTGWLMSIRLHPPRAEDLDGITHLGAQRSTQIVAVRPFSDLDDLVRVDGIGVARVEAIRQEGLTCAS
jgi:DNA uptake protein ComE-like DNA-binding protein